MNALINECPRGDNLSHLQQWLEIAAPVRRVIEQQYTHLTDPVLRTTAAGEENVLFALENLSTYPSVQARLTSGELRLHAWFFKIDTAELFAYDPEAKQFAPLPPP
jgi:carbonic anhydrase